MKNRSSHAWGPSLVALVVIGALASPCPAAAQVASRDGGLFATFTVDLTASDFGLDREVEGELSICVSERRRSLVRSIAVSQVIAVEAAFHRKPTDEWLKSEMKKRATPATESELRAQYADLEKLLDDTRQRYPATRRIGSFESERALLASTTLQDRMEAAGRAIVAELEARRGLKITMRPERHSVPHGALSLGPTKAQLELVLFETCPGCSHGNTRDAGMALVDAFPTLTRFSVHQLPWPGNEKLAEAILCAQEQGGAWKLSDALRRNSGTMLSRSSWPTNDDVLQLAAGVGLDRRRLERCVQSGAQAAEVARDQALARSLGVPEGTPSILFINGRAICGNQTVRELMPIAREELEPLK